MYYIENMPQSIEIGFTGETNIRTIEIDMSAWMETLPNGYPSIVHVRPGETMQEAYVATTSFDRSTGILSWPILSTDLGDTEGTGLAQVWLEEVQNATVTKEGRSAVFATIIRQSVGDNSTTTPPPQVPWLEQMTLLKTQTIIAKDEAVKAQGAAETAEDNAETAEGNAKTYAETAEAYAIGTKNGTADANYATSNARYLAGVASTAATTATNAKNDAVAAQEAAEGYKGNAKTYAETSEAYAVGTKNGVADSDYATSNAQYFATQAAASASAANGDAGTASNAASDADDSAELAAKWAIGSETGTPGATNNSAYFAKLSEKWATANANSQNPDSTAVPSSTNNAEYYAGQAATSAESAASAAAAAALALIDDTAGDGDDDKVWSADKAYDTFATKADKVSNPTSGNFAALDSNGNLTDSGHKHSDYVTDVSGKADKANPVFTGSISLGRMPDTTVGANSFAVGLQAEASAANSHAEGYQTVASAGTAHAEGYQTVASGNKSHAEGGNTIASGSESHAENKSTIAKGTGSHAEGSHTKAYGDYSHAEGQETITYEPKSHVFGKYNLPSESENIPSWAADTAYKAGEYVKYSSKYYCCFYNHTSGSTFDDTLWDEYTLPETPFAEIVGNGTSGNPSNARALDWDGNERLAGDLYVGCNADSTGGKKVTTNDDITAYSAPLIYETESTPADILTIPDGADSLPVKQIVFGIEPVQDLHGYENPWPSGGGKNLLPLTLSNLKTANTDGVWNDNVYTWRGVAFTVISDESGNVTGIKAHGTGDGQAIFSLINGLTLPAGSYKFGIPSSSYDDDARIRVRISGNSWVAIKTEVVSETLASETAMSNFDICINSGKNVSNLMFYPMICTEANYDGTFYSYSNICPISGHTQCDVVRTGKNLCDNLWTNNKAFSNSGGLTNNTSHKIAETYILVKPSTTYTLSGTNIHQRESGNVNRAYVSICSYAADKSFIEFTLNSNSTDAYYTFITPSNARYIRVQVGLGASDVQIEFGSSPTSYVPFVDIDEYTYPFSTTVYGGTFTINRDGSGSLVVNEAQYSFTGQETINLNTSGGRRFMTNAISTLGFPAADTSDAAILQQISSHFKAKTDNVGTIGNFRVVSAIVFTDSGSAYADAAAFSTFLQGQYAAGTPVQVVYKLATPITYQLSALEVIELLKGTNNIYASTGQVLSADLPRDTKLYIDKKLAEMAEAIANA